MTVEDQLRETFHDRSRTVTGWTDPASRVVRGVHRRKRRRLVARTGTAALTVLVIALAAGLIVRQDSRPPALDETLGADATGSEVAEAPFVRHRSARPDAAACVVDPDLMKVEWIVQSTPLDASTGFALRALSGRECTLSGRPVLSGVDVATGLRADVPFVATDPVADGRERQFPATIGPSDPARIEIHGSECPAGQSPKSYRSLSLRFDGQDLPLPDFRNLTSVCGAFVSHWYVEPPVIFAELEATIEAPGTLRRGTDFTYSVRIKNPAPKAFALPGCPVYRLALKADGRTWRRMDCRVSVIDAHGSVRFELTGHIPADAETGTTNLNWTGVLPGGEVVYADAQSSGFDVTIMD